MANGKSCFILLLATLFLALPHPAQAGWKKVFEDNFDGDSLNRDRWFTRFIYNNETLDRLNDEKQVYRDDDNHIVGGGVVKLAARTAGGGSYVSGMIRSKQTFYYGYYETRTKFPKGKGCWPAFWLNSDYAADGKLTWPPEIDIFEFVNNGKDDTPFMVHSAVDNNNPGNTYTYTHPKFHLRFQDYISPIDLTDDWHVWGLMWLPDSVSLYYDGERIYTKTYKWVNKTGGQGAPAHILLNLAIGGQWAGRYGIDDEAFPQSFDIDYVRVYQYDAAFGGKERIANVPDLDRYSYRADGDLKRPVIHPAAGLPATAEAGSLLPVRYRLTGLPTVRPVKLLVSISDTNGKNKSAKVFDLPLDPTTTDSEIAARVSVPLPAMMGDGDYDVRLGLGTCTDDAKIETCKKIPLTPAEGVVRQANAWYKVGRFAIQ